MNKVERKLNPNDYSPKRFGLKYNPPQIIIEYLVPSTGKLYHHKIRLNKIKPDTNLQEVVKDIYEKHYPYLDNKKVNPTQIVKLVEKLSNMKLENIKEGENYHDKEKKDSSIHHGNNKSKLESKSGSKVDINELDDEDEDYYKFFDFENEDLNKLDNDELKKRKDQMEKLYNKNAVLPGDKEFIFDVRVRIYIIDLININFFKF